MRSKHSTAFETINTLNPRILNTLSVDEGAGIYNSPYKEKPLETLTEANTDGMSMYVPDDISFCNTSEFRKTGNHFIKNGVYTNADPLYNALEHKEFWDREEKLCKEGMTLPGKLIKKKDGTFALQKIHITGEHYGYLNFAEIKRSKGFEKKGNLIASSNGEKISKSITSRGGTKNFSLPDFWDGDYYFFKALELCRKIGKHLVVGKARRKGYSYKNGWVAANRANLFPRSTTVVSAYDEASLTEDGTMNKVQNFLDHINKHTDWKKGRLHNTLRHIEIGYRYTGDPTKQGFLSNIYTGVFKTDPGAARGKDADLIFIEEAGKCVNLAEVLDPTLKTLTDGIYTTGLMVVFGTGGGADKYWQAFEDLFYETYARNFITFENIWDEDMEGTGCGFFHSALMSKPGLIDIHGNSDLKASMKFEEKERQAKKHDPVKYNSHCMEEPFSPSEAFSRSGNNIMPSKELDLQLRKVLRDPDYKGIGREGIFVQSSEGIKFMDKVTADMRQRELISPVVNDFPIKPTTDVEGCFVMWEPPYRDPKTGKIPDNLYRIWNDPFGISKDKENFSIKDSLGVCFVYERPNNYTATRGDRIIGAFHGRRENTEDFDEQMFLIGGYYNAKILYENDRGDVYSNAKKRALLDMLVDEPDFMFQKSLQKGGLGRKKGISIAGNSNRKLNGVIYLKKWLLEKRGEDKNGKNLLNLHYIYDIGLLRELLKFDGKRNVDRISGMVVGMFDIREMQYKELGVEDLTPIERDDYFNEWVTSSNPFEKQPLNDLDF